MITKLSNQHLEISISDFGAELQSIFSTDLGLELLWQADPTVWARHAPLLFPIVGKLANDNLSIDSNNYPMKQHGFARDLPFELVAIDENSIEFKLTDSKITRQQYPFAFELCVKYTLCNTTLTCQFTVHNTHTTSLPFSLGGHPAFNWPLIPTVAKKDHRIRFDKPESRIISKLNNGLLINDSDKSPLENQSLSLTDTLFDDDALIFKNSQSKKVVYESLENNKAIAAIEIRFDDFMDLGIWSKPGGNFICLEPWNGFSSPVDFIGDFYEKPGIVSLSVNSSKRMKFEIELKHRR